VSASHQRTFSLWMNTEVAPEAPPLGDDETCDVVVIGAGIAGLSTAYELSRRGKQVVVIDRRRHDRTHHRPSRLRLG
jgi:cation diffusion facilitator CzcD-associated flavoprotein CzcO